MVLSRASSLAKWRDETREKWEERAEEGMCTSEWVEGVGTPLEVLRGRWCGLEIVSLMPERSGGGE